MSQTTTFRGLGIYVLMGVFVFGAAAPIWGQDATSPESSFVVASGSGGDMADTLLAQAEPATPPAPAQTPPQSDFLADIYGRTAASEPDARLAGTPNMFGDSYWEGGNGMIVNGLEGTSSADSPLAGGNRRMKIAENDNTLPQDRVFFLYNHFQNAASIEDATVTPGVQRSISLDRYTIGFEKTFRDGLWAFELRMPFGCGYGYENTYFSSSAGQIGNLSVVLKRLLYKSDTTVAAVGLCIDTPTGSDATGEGQDVQYNIHNQATFLMPYLGVLRTPNDKLFYQCFLQVDLPTNGNRVDYVDNTGATPSSGSFGTLNDQTLMYADLAVGYWLSRNPCANWVTGLAGVIELHYTTTVQDADILNPPAVSGRYFSFGNFANRVDVLDLTVGLHTELVNHTLCRVAGVVPLRTDDDRLFDAEVQFQLERRF